MGEGARQAHVCMSCGGAKGNPDDVSPSLWCQCPLPYKEEVYPNEDLDPPKDPDYYDTY